MNVRYPIPCALIALLAASAALSQTYPSFPGGETDQATLRTQERVEELYVSGAYDRAYFIYRNELAPRGDKFAQYMVGYMHLTGAGVPEDPAVALALVCSEKLPSGPDFSLSRAISSFVTP